MTTVFGVDMKYRSTKCTPPSLTSRQQPKNFNHQNIESSTKGIYYTGENVRNGNQIQKKTRK